MQVYGTKLLTQYWIVAQALDPEGQLWYIEPPSPGTHIYRLRLFATEDEAKRYREYVAKNLKGERLCVVSQAGGDELIVRLSYVTMGVGTKFGGSLRACHSVFPEGGTYPLAADMIWDSTLMKN